MEWKSRRRDVPQRLEPSLSDAALAEEEGLDRFVLHCVLLIRIVMINFLLISLTHFALFCIYRAETTIL